MKTSLRLTALVAGALVLGSAAPAQAPEVAARPPILITSCGQSNGPNMISVLVRRAGLEFELHPMAAAADLKAKPYQSLIITMGSSLKGMGAAGIDIADELQRAAGLIAEARKLKMTVLGAHVEGMKRRAQGAESGDTTDEQTIDLVAPQSDILLVWKDGNTDGRFTTISSQKNIPLVEVEKQIDLVKELEKIFK
ncbi:MAG: hypothetical protein FJY82_10155 [Candidatus Aminicenantes bacterium]|nr:hypothetical protein [Candidatus Aminicenantes bacterium]